MRTRRARFDVPRRRVLCLVDGVEFGTNERDLDETSDEPWCYRRPTA